MSDTATPTNTSISASGNTAHRTSPASKHNGNNKDEAHPPKSHYIDTAPSPLAGMDILKPDHERPLEKFLPITRFALMDRLSSPKAWPPGGSVAAARFYRYLDYWRHQCYNAKLLDLEQSYEPFSPDTDLLMTRKFTQDELAIMQNDVIKTMGEILEQANYEPIDPKVVTTIMTQDTHYGLDLHVDFSLFEECLIYYRGASTRKDYRRRLSNFMMKEEIDLPIFRRLFVLFKIKSAEDQAREIMQAEGISLKKAQRKVKKLRSHLPAGLHHDNIYMKLFKNIPRSDVEMIFPNTVVKFRMFDKVKLGVTSASGLGMGVASAAGKLVLLVTNPVLAAGAVVGLGAVVFRQAMSFVNTKQRYLVIMAQNLYFHSMADNRGVMVKLTDRAADEDVKEEMLLYSVLCKERARRSDLDSIDKAIESYLKTTFGVDVDFDLDDALQRLEADGIVREEPDGYLYTMPPHEAAEHLDAKWDVFLDNLPDVKSSEGIEFERQMT